MHQNNIYSLLAAFIACHTLLHASSQAQQVQQTFWVGQDDVYESSANWDTGFIPEGVLDEVAIINNGGTAIVNGLATSPGGVILGQAAADSGTLQVDSGGSLTAVVGVDGFGVATGEIVVGQNGAGHVLVANGGSLGAEALSSGGSADSSIVLGQVGGSGTAALDVAGTGTLRRNTTVIGPDVAVSFGGLTMTATHSLTERITGASHSVLRSTGPAVLGGSLNVVFDS